MAKIHLSQIESSAFKISSYAGPSVHGMVEAEEEPGILNYMATDCMVKKQGHWKAN